MNTGPSIIQLFAARPDGDGQDAFPGALLIRRLPELADKQITCVTPTG
jgi:hypothetical protein